MKYPSKLLAQSKIGAVMIEPVYFDARYIRIGHHDGISRFSACLFAELAKKIKVIAIVSDLRQLEKLPAGSEYVLLSDPTNPLAELLIPRKLNRLGAKLVFSPMQTMGSFGREYKLALTLHDLIYYRHPTPPPSFSLLVRFGWRLFHLTYFPQRLLLNSADLVVTVSETTKKLIAKHRLTRKSVKVVYNAGSVHTVEIARQFSGANNLVYMGSFMEYKNVETLIVAMDQLPDFKLSLLSKIDDRRKLELLSLTRHPERIEFLNGVTDKRYGELIDSAFALVSASRDEGFGIPVIESMERGTPVIISDLEIFHEIGGEAAIYFVTDSADDFAEKVRLLNEEVSWNDKSAACVKQAKKFSWAKSAEQLVSALGSIAN